jgi:hypothetical protein
MTETQPRYEFRVWAQNFDKLRERLERRATPVRAVSEKPISFPKRPTEAMSKSAQS